MNTYKEMHWTPEMTTRFWDWQSQYPETYFTYQFGEGIVRSLSSHLQGRATVLDYGSGAGHLIPHLCLLCDEVFAADMSPQSISKSASFAAHHRNFKGAWHLQDPELATRRFDAIIAIEVVEHLYDRELETMLSQVRSLLVPGGVAIVTTPNDENLERNMILCPVSGEVFHRWQHVRSWNAESLPMLLHKHGFEVKHTIETNLAKRPIKSPKDLVKSLIRKLFLPQGGQPHLVCVATVT